MAEGRTPRVLVIVQRERADIFRQMTERFAGEVDVLWDRRYRQRRGLADPVARERRAIRDRREPSPAIPTWLGFRIVRERGA